MLPSSDDGVIYWILDWFIVLDSALPSDLRIGIIERKSIASIKMDTMRFFSVLLFFIQNPRFTTGSDSSLFIRSTFYMQSLECQPRKGRI